MNLSSRRGLCLLALLGPLGVSSPAAAQDVAAADALFNRGVAEMKAGNPAKGCPLIAESLRIDPQPGTLFTLSQCEVKWGRTATAVARLDDYLQLYDRLTPDQKAQQLKRLKVVREQRDQMAGEVPELTLALPASAPAGTVVKRDDAVVAGAALGLRLPVDPGEHVISTQAPGGPVRELKITIRKGEKRPILLVVDAAPAVEERRAPRESPTADSAASTESPVPVPGGGPSGRRVAAYAIGGVGIAGLVVGGVMGGLALGKKAILDENCGPGVDPKHPSDATACKPAGLTAAASVKSLGLGSTVGSVVGLAGIATAVVLILTEHRTAPAVTGARGPWISANVLSLGSEGAIVGARCAW
jgi:hypothetical protein